MMDTLPDEILQEIMEYLGHSDLKCCRLVCRKFYNASLAFSIVNREKFVFGDHMISKLRQSLYNFYDFIKILSTTERNFYHFHFIDTAITTARFREFAKKRAMFVLSLKFENCKIICNTIDFYRSINDFSKLKSLEAHNTFLPLFLNDTVTVSLPSLENLTMDISIIPDGILHVLTYVKNLSVCIKNNHFNDWDRIQNKLNYLRSVELLYSCSDEQLMQFADSLNLTTIRMNCVAVTDRGFIYFVDKQRRLQIVEMSNLRFITNESLFAIAEYLKHLQELTFNAFISTTYSFDALNRIINFTPVRRLSVYGSADDSGLTATVGGDVTVSKSLRQLYMSNVQNEMYVTYIAENLLSLTELELMSSNGITNETLRLICRNLKNLKKLILKECNAINVFENDVSQLTFSANFKNLEHLDLCHCQWISDSTLETCFNLSSLRILNVDYCKKLTVKSFVAMPKNCPNLENLCMVGVRVDNNVLLSTVSLMKRLRELKIWVLEPVAEHLLHSLYEHSDSLQHIMFDKSRFIRSWQRKTFVEARLRIVYADDDVDDDDDDDETRWNDQINEIILWSDYDE